MARVLVKGAVIQCGHGGQLRLTTGDERLTVAGNGAVTSGMEAGLVFGSPPAPLPGMAPCTAALPNGTFVPCVTAAALLAGLATKLTVGGTAVLLDTASGQTVTVAAGPRTWSVSDAGQQKLEAL
jgi:hypothetical protein